MLADYLRKEGFLVKAPPPSEIDQKTLSTLSKWSLILLDEAMAQKIGDKILDAKHKQEIFLPVIVLTSQATRVNYWFEAGYDNVLLLPVRQKTFLAFLQHLIIIRVQSQKLYQQAQELAESEARYRQFVESPLVGFWLADEKAKFVFINQRLAEMSGYQVDEVVGKMTMLDPIAPESRDWLQQRLAQRRKGAITPDVVEVEMVRKDGSRFWALAAPAGIYDSRGKFKGYLGAMIDISERKKLEQLLIESNQELEAYARTVSHDLRAPLRAVQGYINILREDCGQKLDDQARHYLERIDRAAQNMDNLIIDLLNYSRLSHEEFLEANVSGEEVLEEVINYLDNEIKKKKAQINIIKPLPAVKANRNFLFQVFLNLIDNALKFIVPGQKPEVKIWAERRGKMVRFWFEDKGLGIEPRYHQRIFELFERLHGIESYPGTGVGLALVKKVVKKMKGEVGLESQLGRGSRFWIELPAANPGGQKERD